MAANESIPRVSVVMAAYNGEPFLAEAIRSILGQTFGDFEFIIVDDGSQDGSAAIVRSFDDPRVRLVTNERNVGLTPSLNRGLTLARGEFVARQDADDVSEPTRLARQIAVLDARPEVALVGTGYHEIDELGTHRGTRTLPLDATALRWALRFYCPFIHTSVVLRREPVLRQVGTYDERFAYAQDYDYWLRIADVFAVANIAEPLVRYRVQPNSMTATHPRADAETQSIGADAVAAASGWHCASLDERARRFRVLVSLVHGPFGAWPPRELLRGADDAAVLLDWFCDRYRLPLAEADIRRRALRAHLRRELRHHGLAHMRRGRITGAARLLARAMRSGSEASPPSRPTR